MLMATGLIWGLRLGCIRRLCLGMLVSVIRSVCRRGSWSVFCGLMRLIVV